ncbi:hypothetical protein Tco_0670982, partial [Tanacetum coccineum]
MAAAMVAAVKLAKDVTSSCVLVYDGIIANHIPRDHA